MTVTKNCENGWNCFVFGDKEVPKNKISKWKIKINKKISKNFWDFYIGIGPKLIKKQYYNECWSLVSANSEIKANIKGEVAFLNIPKGELKIGDIIEVIVDRKLGNLSFAVNGVNFGIISSNIPKDDELYPSIILYENGASVEIV